MCYLCNYTFPDYKYGLRHSKCTYVQSWFSPSLKDFLPKSLQVGTLLTGFSLFQNPQWSDSFLRRMVLNSHTPRNNFKTFKKLGIICVMYAHTSIFKTLHESINICKKYKCYSLSCMCSREEATIDTINVEVCLTVVFSQPKP